MRVAVLGGSGFLGSWVCAAFASAGHQVRAASRRPLPVDAWTDLPARDRVRTLSLDLRQPDAVATACEGVDVVVCAVSHTRPGATWRVAADDPEARAVIVGVPAALAELAAQSADRPLLLLAGSVTQPRSSQHPPASGYDRLKDEAERIVLGAARAGHLRAAALRLSTIYGPAASPTGPDQGVVTAMVTRAAAGQPLTLWHDSSPRRDLLYVADAAEAFVAAARAGDALDRHWWDVGSGQVVPLRELFTAIAARTAVHTATDPVPVERVPPPGYATVSDTRDADVDPAPFMRVTGWRPRMSWQEGLDATIRQMLARQPAGPPDRQASAA